MLIALLQNAAGDLSWFCQPPDPPAIAAQLPPSEFAKPVFPPTVVVLTYFTPSFPDLIPPAPTLAASEYARDPFPFVPFIVTRMPELVPPPRAAPPDTPIVRPFFVPGTYAWQPRWPDLIPPAPTLAVSEYARDPFPFVPFIVTRMPELVPPPRAAPELAYARPVIFTAVPFFEAVYPDLIDIGKPLVPSWFVQPVFPIPTPPTPPPSPPIPVFSNAGTSGGAGSGWDWCDDDYYEPIREDLREECRRIEEEAAAQAPPEDLGDVPPPSVPEFVIDLLGTGGAGFAINKTVTNLARGKLGKHGAAAVSVGALVATWKASKRWPKARAAIVTGSAISTFESLYHLYVAEGKVPPKVHRIPKDAFIGKIRTLRRPIQSTARQVLMKGTSGRLYRVLVIQYTITAADGTEAWFYQEARKFDEDGSINIDGTILERLKPSGR